MATVKLTKKNIKKKKQDNDFVFLSDLDNEKKHRFMYFDLLRLE